MSPHARARCAGLVLLLLVGAVLESATAETLVLNTGNPSMPGRLGYGWAPGEFDGERIFAWINQQEGDIWFDVQDPRPAEIVLTAAPYYLERTQQAIGVFINNRYQFEWVCNQQPGMHFETFRGRIPAGAFSNGLNRLTFRLGYVAHYNHMDFALAVDEVRLIWE